MSSGISYRKLLAASAIVFVLLLVFMAGRVRAGGDPAQANARPAISTPEATAPPEDSGFPEADPPSTEAS